MNKEICQKCKHQVRYFSIDNITNGYLHFHGYTYIGNFVCQCCTNDQYVIDKYSDILIEGFISGKCMDIPATEIFNIKEIKAMSTCPYYIEHEIFDLNK